MNSRQHLIHFGSMTVIILSLVSGAPSRAQDLRTQPARAARSAGAQLPNLATFSPDGDFYAVSLLDGRIKYGRTRDGATVRTFYECRPRALQFSPDGRLLAILGGGFHGYPVKVTVWQVKDGAMLAKVDPGWGEPPLLSFSPDGRLLVTTAEGSRIKLWQLPKGTLKWSVKTSGLVTRLAFADEGRAVVAVYGDGSVQQFSVP